MTSCKGSSQRELRIFTSAHLRPGQLIKFHELWVYNGSDITQEEFVVGIKDNHPLNKPIIRFAGEHFALVVSSLIVRNKYFNQRLVFDFLLQDQLWRASVPPCKDYWSNIKAVIL